MGVPEPELWPSTAPPEGFRLADVVCSRSRVSYTRAMNIFRQAKDLLDKKDAGSELSEEELRLLNTAMIAAEVLFPRLVERLLKDPNLVEKIRDYIEKEEGSV